MSCGAADITSPAPDPVAISSSSSSIVSVPILSTSSAVEQVPSSSSAYVSPPSSSSAYVSPPPSSAVYIPPPIVTPSPLNVTYDAGSNTTYGEFFISYTIHNYSTVPVAVTSGAYAIYGSVGGILGDTVLTRNELILNQWIQPDGTLLGWLEGYSVSYIPYSFSFQINTVGTNNLTDASTFSGIFKVFLTKRAAQPN